MPNEYDDSMDEHQNYRHQSRCHIGKTINGRRECRDDVKNYSQHRDVKLQNYPSHECQFKNSRKHDRENMRMTVASDQRLGTGIPDKPRIKKSRSPLTNRRSRNCKPQEISYESFADDFEGHEQSIYPDHERFVDKSQRRKNKEEIVHDCMETIQEDDELMKIRKKRIKNEKGKLKAERCLHELDELKNELAQFEYKKMMPEKHLNDKKRRNQLNSKVCPKELRHEESDIDNDEEEEETKRLEEELAKITFCEPCSHPKHAVKTPETTTSATETSIVEETDERGQRTIRRVIDDAIMRENAYNADKNMKHTHGDEASSEATCSDRDDDPNETLRGSQNRDDKSTHFIDELKKLKWSYLNHIQDELNRLYDLEQFLDTLTAKNLKSVRRNDNGKERPTTRGAGLQ